MRDREFEEWLKHRYPNPNSWKTYLSETRRIARHKGNLDDLYEATRFTDLFASFRFSKSNGLAPSDDIPHNADPYVTASFRRQCIQLYAEFFEQTRHDVEAFLWPNEIGINDCYFEGAVQSILVNKYERDQSARTACLNYYGQKCHVCCFDFYAVYGCLGRGYIHVHHLRELSSIGVEYEVNPIEDLRPVCPNCHAMLHRRRPALLIEELQATIKKSFFD